MIRKIGILVALVCMLVPVVTSASAAAAVPPSALRCLNNETPSYTSTVTLSPANDYRAVVGIPDNLWAGDTWKLTAVGQVDDGREGTWSPKGSGVQAPGDWPAAWTSKYSLVQRTGGPDRFFGYAGAATSCLTWNGPPAKTSIEIMMNDPYRADNTGTWTVTLTQWYGP